MEGEDDVSATDVPSSPPQGPDFSHVGSPGIADSHFEVEEDVPQPSDHHQSWTTLTDDLRDKINKQLDVLLVSKMDNVEDLTQMAVVVAAAYACYTFFLVRIHKYRLGKPVLETKIERESVRDIFEIDRATGSKAETESAKEKVRRWQRGEREIRIDDIDFIQTQNEVHLESFDDFETASLPHQGSPQIPSSSTPSVSMTQPKGKKRKAPKNDMIDVEIKMMTDSLNNIAAALTDIKAKMEKVFAELTTMELEEEIIFKAIDTFQSDPKLCDTFFACPMEMRARWLFRKMSEHI